MKLRYKQIIKSSAVCLAIVMTCLLIMSAPFSHSTTFATSTTVQSYNDQISALQAQQDELETKIANVEAEEASTAEYKAYLDSLVTTVASKIQIQESLLTELDNSIADLKQQIEEHDAAIAETTEKIRARMLANQQTGDISYLDVLIGAEGIGDFLSRVEMVNNLMEYDKETLDKYKVEKENLEAEKSDLEASLKMQTETKEKLEADKSSSEALATQTEAYLETLASDKVAYQAQYEEAKRQEAALDAELTAYLQSLAAQNSSQVTADGEYMWPLPTGQGYISCYYGDSDPNGAPHYAVDCAISSGTPIYASNDGTVVKAEWHYSYGNFVLIDHGNGCATLYAHMSGIAVSAGSTVAKGQVIGYVGSTGFSTGNHLHFEFRVNGSKVNPLGYMACGV